MLHIHPHAQNTYTRIDTLTYTCTHAAPIHMYTAKRHTYAHTQVNMCTHTHTM